MRLQFRAVRWRCCQQRSRPGFRPRRRGDARSDVNHSADLPLADIIEPDHVVRVDGERDVLLARRHIDLVLCRQAPGLAGEDVKSPTSPTSVVVGEIGVSQARSPAVALVVIRRLADSQEVRLVIPGKLLVGVDRPRVTISGTRYKRSALGIDACAWPRRWVRRVPIKCASALRARLIDDFSARYLSVQKNHNLQKISARSNFSSMESRPKRAHMLAHYGQSRRCRFHLPWVPGTL